MDYTDPADLMIAALVGADDIRPRTTQQAVGPSDIGGCGRRVWHKVQGHHGSNPTRRLAAILGTAVHTAIEEGVERMDPFGDRWLRELRVSFAGVFGTVDLYDKAQRMIVDWKTTKVGSLAYFPGDQYRGQVHLYGYLATKCGYPVDEVAIVGFPKDGDERDVVTYREPYDESLALDLLARLDRITTMEEPPPPERQVAFCAPYCPFYGDQCSGITQESDAPVLDGEAAALAREAFRLSAEKKATEKALAAIKSELEGITGQTDDGFKVTWVANAGRKSIDTAALKAAGVEIPYTHGTPFEYMTVSRVKS